MNITSYFIFNGQAEEAAGFYADALGGKVENLHRYESMPPQPGVTVPDDSSRRYCTAASFFPAGR